MKVALLEVKIVILLTIAVCDAARILVVLPIFAKSHHYVFSPIIKALAERGHDITFYSPIRLGQNYTNVKEVEIHLPIEKMFSEMDFAMLREFGKMPTVRFIDFWPLGIGTVADALVHPEIQKLIHSDDKYDLVVLETHFGQEAFVALGHKFKAPVVSLGTFITFSFIDEFLGNPFATSYLPGFELPYDDDMTFLQRCHNTVRLIATLVGGYYLYLPYQNNLMRTHFNYTGSETLPPLTDMLHDVALVIINSHVAVDYPRPFLPNVIGTAGLHIAPKNKPLPKDLKDFLDNSKHGVVLVSFGSLVPAHKMPVEMRDALINAFKTIKQDVLWKLPVDSLPGLSKNVKISKWLPQQDVLAHPNIKAFVTHGGLLSQSEAVYYGVPLISVPFFGDQPMNAKRAAKHEFSVYLDSYNLTEESVSWALNEILTNPKYRENMKHRSEVFRTNPQTSIDKAVYWIEYVIKFNGAPHLRSSARKMSYIKYLLLDVFAFLAVTVLLFLFSVYLIIKLACSLCFKKTSQVQSSKKQN